jgi:hypothetical protein
VSKEWTASQWYARADDLLSKGTRCDLRTPFLCPTKPAFLIDDARRKYEGRLSALSKFFEICLEIFRDALSGRAPPSVYRFLLNDTPATLRRSYHRKVPINQYFPPRFFRTDETPDGKIMEIQCPGSGWGDLQFLCDVYRECGGDDRLQSYSPSAIFAREVIRVVSERQKNENPSILHLLDNASAPASMKYLIHSSHPPLSYWGFHNGVRYRKCDFVRSHSFFGLVAENLFQVRLADAAKGLIYFDQPPIVLFDQKAPLALPFWNQTRHLFPDEVRDCLVYTYPILPKNFPEDGPLGFYNEHGQWVTVDDLLKMRSLERQYFVKYSGTDVSINWGSYAVECLSARGANKCLRALPREYSKRKYWVVQPDVSSENHVEYFDRNANQIESRNWHSKLSCFYSDAALIGIKTMHRDAVTVHGQEDTVVGLIVP